MHRLLSFFFFMLLATQTLLATDGPVAPTAIPGVKEYEFIDCYYISAGIGLVVSGSTDVMLLRYKRVGGPIKYGLAYRLNAGIGLGAGVSAGTMGYNAKDVEGINKRVKIFNSNLTSEKLCFIVWADREEERGTFVVAGGRHLLSGVGLGILKTAVEWPILHLGSWVNVDKDAPRGRRDRAKLKREAIAKLKEMEALEEKQDNNL